MLVAAAAAVGWVWLSDGGRDGQDRVLLTIPIAFATVLLLAIWLVFFSRLPWSRRRWAIGAVLAIVAITAATTRIRGVTGDLVPILEWRWASRCPAASGAAVARNAAFESGRAERCAEAPVPDRLLRSLPLRQRRSMRRHQYGVPATIPSSSAPTATGWSPAFGSRTTGTRDRRVSSGGGQSARDGPVLQSQEAWRSRRSSAATVKWSWRTLATGVPKWSHGDEAHYESTIAGEGPRATPTISRGRVFTLGSTGSAQLPRSRNWPKDLAAGYRRRQPVAAARIGQEQLATPRRRSDCRQRRRPRRSFARRVFPGVGRAGVARGRRPRQLQFAHCGHARRRATGRRPQSVEHRWTRSGDRPCALEPSLAAHDAKRRIPARPLRRSRSALGGLWDRQPGSADFAGRGRRDAALVWESTRLKAKFTNPVLHEGFVYGLDDGVLVCLDPANGERRWKGGRYGHGQTILVGNRLLVQTEDGEIVLVDPVPMRTTSSPDSGPSIRRPGTLPRSPADLLVRTDTEAACYELAE